MDKVSYALGLGIGRQLCDMGAKALNIDDFAQAIKDVILSRRSATRKHSKSCRISSKSKKRSSVQLPKRNTRTARLQAKNTSVKMQKRTAW